MKATAPAKAAKKKPAKRFSLPFTLRKGDRLEVDAASTAKLRLVGPKNLKVKLVKRTGESNGVESLDCLDNPCRVVKNPEK
jgi:hypothetical protein